MIRLSFQSYFAFVITIECLIYPLILTSNVTSSASQPKRQKGKIVGIASPSPSNTSVQDVKRSEEVPKDRFSLQVHEQNPSVVVEKINRMLYKPYTNWHMGKVPYYLDTESYDEIIADRIRKAMDTIEMPSCVVFEPLQHMTDDEDWVHITNPGKVRDCVHKFDRGMRRELIMVLGFDCMTSRDILHSLMHVLGFKDEVTHPQRDMYVRILWENIHPNYRPLFRLNTEPLPYDTKVEYDTMSVMHFHVRAFSANGKATIAPLIPGLVFTPTNSLSQLDIMKLGLAYGHECNKRKVNELIQTCKKTLATETQSDYEEYYSENSEAITFLENNRPVYDTGESDFDYENRNQGKHKSKNDNDDNNNEQDNDNDQVNDNRNDDGDRNENEGDIEAGDDDKVHNDNEQGNVVSGGENASKNKNEIRNVVDTEYNAPMDIAYNGKKHKYQREHISGDYGGKGIIVRH